MTTPRCTGPLCDRPVVSRGLCDAHRQQRRNHPGKPTHERCAVTR